MLAVLPRWLFSARWKLDSLASRRSLQVSEFRHYQKKRMGLGKRLLTMSNAISGKPKRTISYEYHGDDPLTERIRAEYLRRVGEKK